MFVDEMRRAVIEGLYKLKKPARCWPIWYKEFNKSVSRWDDPVQVMHLSERLSDAFAKTKKVGPKTQSQEQSETAGGGSAWEALVCWYMNLCLIGTTAIVVKRRRSVGAVINKAITVKYGNTTANSESDLLAISFPRRQPFTSAYAGFKKDRTATIDAALESGGMAESQVAVIQCKTNWNDNAQIPMLWSHLYRTGEYEGSKIRVGTGGFNPSDFASFAYAFVTVPTNKIESYKPNSICVARLADLTGGNYWGRRGQEGIASALHDIFPRAGIGPDKGRGVRRALATNLRRLPTDYAYFGVGVK